MVLEGGGMHQSIHFPLPFAGLPGVASVRPSFARAVCVCVWVRQCACCMFCSFCFFALEKVFCKDRHIPFIQNCQLEPCSRVFLCVCGEGERDGKGVDLRWPMQSREPRQPGKGLQEALRKSSTLNYYCLCLMTCLDQ